MSTLLDRVVLRKHREGGVHPWTVQIVWRDETVMQSPDGWFYDAEPDEALAA